MYEESFRAQFGGIGVSMRIHEESKLPVVERLMFGAAGEAAGVRVGDTIVKVDGRPTTGMDMDAVMTAFSSLRDAYHASRRPAWVPSRTHIGMRIARRHCRPTMPRRKGTGRALRVPTTVQ